MAYLTHVWVTNDWIYCNAFTYGNFCNDEFIAINMVNWGGKRASTALFRCQDTICLLFLENKAILWRYKKIHFLWGTQLYLPFFTHFSMTISVPSVLESAWLGKTHFLETKFGGEHFPETPYIPFLSQWVWSSQPHRRWIKSIGLLFLLHNAGSVSVLTDPQLINGQDRLLWSW